MLLRPEVHLILWVSALAFVGMALFHGTVSTHRPVGEAETRTVQFEPETSGANASESIGRSAANRKFFEVADGTRPLFFVRQLTRPIPVPAMPEMASGPPSLKGVVISADSPRAVFYDTGAAAYLTRGVGDEVGGYRILKILADRVLVRSEDGDLTLYLRGAGERPN